MQSTALDGDVVECPAVCLVPPARLPARRDPPAHLTHPSTWQSCIGQGAFVFAHSSFAIVAANCPPHPSPHVRSCSASCGRRSCLGLFASEGRCEPCGDSCADCNAKGQCLACQRFYGLVNGTCQHCEENCYSWWAGAGAAGVGQRRCSLELAGQGVGVWRRAQGLPCTCCPSNHTITATNKCVIPPPCPLLQRR